MPEGDQGGDPLERLPHAGPARLPDRLVHIEPDRVVASRELRPHDSCLNEEGRLPGMLLVELMAQVGGLLMETPEAGQGGFLAGVKSMHIHDTASAGETITVECRAIRRMGSLTVVEARGTCGDRDLAHGVIQIGLRRLG